MARRRRSCLLVLLVLCLSQLQYSAVRRRLYAVVRQWVRGSSAMPHRCLPDELASSDTFGDASPAHAERFLFYSPQFGHSNQLVALRNAAAWAAVLNRTLVLPHLLGHATEAQYRLGKPDRPKAAYAEVFDLARARRGVRPLKLVQASDFLALGLRPQRVLQVTGSALKLVRLRDDYFEALSLKWGPPLEIRMRSFTPHSIRYSFGGCTHHRVLAFRSLFAAWDVRPGRASPPGWMVGRLPGLTWLDKQAMPALLAPVPNLSRLVHSIHNWSLERHDSLLPPSRANATLADSGVGRQLPRELACLHLRRGDFEVDCPKYAAEARSKQGRGWVKSHFQKGWSCLQSDRVIEFNIQKLQQRAQVST
ncbi:hypothetical protein AB1Y20_000343 [Prymnesium parvum]|uniref:Peptide-O-fucosyltransferase 1 n=1 Tax=Prymnesium parvum TaxID=97485 RepID=A0AB34K7U7_PRYPA